MNLPVLRAARKAADLSQAELADLMGVVKSTVAGWELGTHSIQSKRLPMLARILKVRVSSLLQ